MGWHPSLKKPKKGSQDLSVAALSLTTAFGRAFKLEQVTIKASVPISETVTITLVSVEGATYDVVLGKHVLDAESQWVWRPDGECNWQAGDEVKVECTAANLTGIVYAKIKASEILL